MNVYLNQISKVMRFSFVEKKNKLQISIKSSKRYLQINISNENIQYEYISHLDTYLINLCQQLMQCNENDNSEWDYWSISKCQNLCNQLILKMNFHQKMHRRIALGKVLLLALGEITNVGTHHGLHCKLERLVNALISIAIEMRNESFAMIKNAQTIIIKLIVIKYLFVVGINTNAQTMIMTRLIIKKLKNNVDLNHLIIIKKNLAFNLTTYDQSQPQIQNFLVVYKNSLILPVYFILFLFFLFKQL
ncbi:unnamed protein product [Paramecium octaurelia]|uniref:Transmembrane protein n=1 Tax=Paramecium octaurelia TaxID=43137 RepID=A0A8S1UC44_PAROT|nr:unnamed protein product [Paramecium octaurelia]